MKEKLKNYCDFDKGVYVVMAVARKKDNDLTKSQEIVIRDVLREERDIDRRYPRLIKQITDFKEEGKPVNFYVYVSCNPRDYWKAFYNFQQKSVYKGHYRRAIQAISARWIFNSDGSGNACLKIGSDL